MPGQDGAGTRRDGRATKTPERLAANRPVARALRLARGTRKPEEWAAALRTAGVPATGNQVWSWELGAEPDARNVHNISIVPAYILVAASRVTDRPVGDLLTAAGVEGQDPYRDQLADLQGRVFEIAYIRRRQQMIEEALNELRAERGLPPLPVIDEEAVD